MSHLLADDLDLKQWASLSNTERNDRMKILIFTDPDTGKKGCTLCKKLVARPYDHIENVHLCLAAYQCDFCDKSFKSRNLRAQHVHYNHKEEKKVRMIISGNKNPQKY